MDRTSADPVPSCRLASVLPQVRYVDRDLAIIEVTLTFEPAMVTPGFPVRACPTAQLLVEISGDDGFHDEQWITASAERQAPRPRLEVVHPRRWWPAGMGAQALYTVRVHHVWSGRVLRTLTSTVGMTSVRQPDAGQPLHLLVNGEPRQLREVVTIDHMHERMLLPASGDTLLLVRDHYGPDALYDAADRAGILLIQCVPIDPAGDAPQEARRQVQRLAHHPCLIGWCAGNQGPRRGEVARRLRTLDPGHCVFEQVPPMWAA